MAQCKAHVICLGLVACGLWLPVGPAQAQAQAPQKLTRPATPAGSATLAFDADVPPPTAYDRAMAEAPGHVQPETKGLLHLAGRLIAALVAVLALIYASLKFLLPRYFKKWSHGPNRELHLIERLSLDGHNAVVLVALQSGKRVLLGTGEHGVQFLTDVTAPGSASFHATMTAGQAAGDGHREDAHAAEH